MTVINLFEGWHRIALSIIFATGCRVGEAASLTWGDVDFDRRTLRLTGKTGTRVVPLSEDLQALLSNTRGTTSPDEYVVPAPSRASARQLVGNIRQTATRAGVRVFTPNGVRRLAADRLYRSGVDVGTAAAILGHSPTVALTYYRRATADDKRQAIERSGLGRLTGNVVRFSR